MPRRSSTRNGWIAGARRRAQREEEHIPSRGGQKRGREGRNGVGADIVSIMNDITTVRISGKLRQPESAALEKVAVEVFQQQGKMRILIRAEDFQGRGQELVFSRRAAYWQARRPAQLPGESDTGNVE